MPWTRCTHWDPAQISLFSLMKNILTGLRPKYVKNDILLPLLSLWIILHCTYLSHAVTYGTPRCSLWSWLTGSALEEERCDAARTHSILLAVYRKPYKATASFQKKQQCARNNKLAACLSFSAQFTSLSFAVPQRKVPSCKLWFCIPPCYCS